MNRRRLAAIHRQLAELHRALATEYEADAIEGDVAVNDTGGEAPERPRIRKAPPEPSELDRRRAAEDLRRLGYRVKT